MHMIFIEIQGVINGDICRIKRGVSGGILAFPLNGNCKMRIGGRNDIRLTGTGCAISQAGQGFCICEIM